MTTRTTPWPAGVPCWADLTAPDPAVARAFYAAVLPWDVEDPTLTDPDGTYGGYALAHVDGHAAAGIGPQPSADVPAAWTLYLATPDVDDVVGRVPDAGGTVLLPTEDVGDLGRLALVADPGGAVVGLWQAGAHIGAGHVNAPGGMVWEDLRTSDPDGARAFYAALAGWESAPMPGAPEDYQTFALPGGDPLGGIGGFMTPEPAPPHWLVYFGVEDTAAAVGAAQENGGTLVTGPFGTPFGEMAVLADPGGAVFVVVETTEDQETSSTRA